MHTECYIKSSGYNPTSHRYVIFNSLINRHLSTPLEQTEYTKKYKHILEAEVNGFDKQLIEKKMRTFRRLKHIKETTTLSILDKNVTYKMFTYHP